MANVNFCTTTYQCRINVSAIDAAALDLLSINMSMSSTCPDNMVNFGPLPSETSSNIWGTPANFNWFRVLAALLHGI